MKGVSDRISYIFQVLSQTKREASSMKREPLPIYKIGEIDSAY